MAKNKLKPKYIVGLDKAGRASPSKHHYVIGIDEAGRGPLAGRISVAAVLLSAKKHHLVKNGIKEGKKYIPLRDSKKLSSIQREIWFRWIKKQKIAHAASFVSSRKIDKINVSQACNLAARKSVEKLIKKNKKIKATLVADGGINLNFKINKFSFISFPKADERVPAVALASIVAKVLRDREMRRLHKRYPQYGLSDHKGYGTKKHILAIKKHGPSPIHRLTFIRKYHKIKNI